jgi:phospholipid/cholesterol/gamma-HCH transport system substrate-binding protein
LTEERAEGPEREEEERSGLSRLVGVLALLVALGATAFLLLFGRDSYEVTAEFEDASQLTEGNEVVIAGSPAGSVERIELAPDGAALVTFTVDEQFAPLHRGTTATVRSYSLSGIANRQVQLTLPPPDAAGEEIADGGVMDQSETVSEVDLDEVFNTLDDRTVRNLKKVIRGFEVSYDGVGPQANRGFRYLNPFLSSSRRLFTELNRDEGALQQLIVDGSQLSSALAERAPDIEQLVGNLDRMMGALAAQKAALAESVAKFPAFMRRANTTFVNLRAALDDLDPLVDASKPVARRLRPFMAELRATAAGAVPTLRDLDRILAHPGRSNDLVELTRLQVPLAKAALGSGRPECGRDPVTDYLAAADDDFDQGAFGESVCSLRNSLPQLAFFRSYSPELVGWFDGFSHSGVEDAHGGAAVVETIFNTFSVSEATGLPVIGEPGFVPQPFSESLEQGLVTTGATNKCPGANERPLGAADPADHSVPFLDGSTRFTDPLDCDPSAVPQGP